MFNFNPHPFYQYDDPDAFMALVRDDVRTADITPILNRWLANQNMARQIAQLDTQIAGLVSDLADLEAVRDRVALDVTKWRSTLIAALDAQKQTPRDRGIEYTIGEARGALEGVVPQLDTLESRVGALKDKIRVIQRVRNLLDPLPIPAHEKAIVRSTLKAFLE